MRSKPGFSSGGAQAARSPNQSASFAEYEKFRHIGEADTSEGAFVLDRKKCKWQAPPVPIARKWIYRDCMAEPPCGVPDAHCSRVPSWSWTGAF